MPLSIHLAALAALLCLRARAGLVAGTCSAEGAGSGDCDDTAELRLVEANEAADASELQVSMLQLQGARQAPQSPNTVADMASEADDADKEFGWAHRHWDSCHNNGCGRYKPGAYCQCNDQCTVFGNCCPDYKTVCMTGSCKRQGCGEYDPHAKCHCNPLCRHYNNCCSDYQAVCVDTPDAPDSCGEIKCNTAYNPRFDCQCNKECVKYNSCCSDYRHLCLHVPLIPTPRPAPPTHEAPTFTFYMYRSQNDEAYPPLNTNMASLGGSLWYLHNEVVSRCDDGRGDGVFGYRRFRITRILRYKVTLKTTAELYRTGMNFGVRVAFDKGACTGAFKGRNDCKKVWDHYGYIVGCNVLGEGPYPSCPPFGSDNGEGYCPIKYPGAVWYSLPGPCPDSEFDKCDEATEARYPGGYTKGKPDGSRTSTWTYEEAGEINIDELVGISKRYSSHKEFCERGCLEYVKYGGGRDRGKCISWWDGWHDESKNKARMAAVDDLFYQKYPQMPREASLAPPKCDFNRDAFYRGMR